MSVILGMVVDAADRPVAAARVFFVSGPGDLPEVALLSDADGRFVLGAPQPGLYRLGCASDDAGSGAAEVEVGTADASVFIRLRG